MDNFDPYNVLLSIATNIPVLLMTAFVLQGSTQSPLQSTHSTVTLNSFQMFTNLSLHAPFHSLWPHGFLMRIMESFSDLKNASRPEPRRTLRTSVTAYAWPLTKPQSKRASISAWLMACGKESKYENVRLGRDTLLHEAQMHVRLTLMEQLIRPPLLWIFSTRSNSWFLASSSWRNFPSSRSMGSDTPPVKSTRASAVFPPSKAS